MSIQIVLLRPKADGTLYHCHPKGFPQGLTVPNIHSLFENREILREQLLAADPGNLTNVFYTVAHHSGTGGPMPSRTKLTFEKQTVLAFDIDKVDTHRAWDYLPTVAKILGVMPANLIFVCSGTGLHVLAHLKTAIRSEKYITDTRPHYGELLFKIAEELKILGLPFGKIDPSVYDAPRILRFPGSINDKKGKISQCDVLQYPGLDQLDIDLIKISGLNKQLEDNIPRDQIVKHYPRPDFKEIVAQCEFIKDCLTTGFAHEPEFMKAAAIAGACNPADKADYKDQQLNPRELAGVIYDQATDSKSLAGVSFDSKWEHAIRYGAPKCSTVATTSPESCAKCPHQHKIPTPLAIKSVEHISSSANGYWVHGKNGPLHPHYSDLAKIYAQEAPYVSCEPERIFTFGNGLYRPTGPLTIKSWLDKKVGFNEYLRDMHCTEFFKRVLRSKALTETAEDELFNKSIEGRMNCQNGVVDVKTGELYPHGPEYGFKYILPYDYIPDQVSEFFLDWLSEVMKERTELMESVLDIMTYCLWPGYEDHFFAYFIGEGQNGKSTLLHVLKGLLGEENTTCISATQLSTNKFAPADLEGKLANISEESSGTELGAQALDIIKSLSAKGSIRVEHKNQNGFSLTNSAKLIFSANKMPKFHESGKALRRRLLVIPFDHTFEVVNSKIEDKLMEEVPKIFSMLITRCREIIRANDGVFKLSRGGLDALRAQEKVLLSGNSCVEWSKDCLESGLSVPEDKYITTKDAYNQYKEWCIDNTYKPYNLRTFQHTMNTAVLSTVSKNTVIMRVGGLPQRVYPRTQWRTDL